MEIQNEKAEQEWIAKYRAAVNGVPSRRSQFAKLRAVLGRAWRSAISRVGLTPGKPNEKRKANAVSQPRGHFVEGSRRRLENAVQKQSSAHARNPRSRKSPAAKIPI